MCDELFDDQAQEERAGALLWLKTSSYVQKDGFREGYSAGEEATLQAGFNEGFKCSSQVLFHIAQLRGEVSGLLSLSLMRGGTLDKTRESQLQELLGDIILYETEMLNFNNTALKQFQSHNDTACMESGSGDAGFTQKCKTNKTACNTSDTTCSGDAGFTPKFSTNKTTCIELGSGDADFTQEFKMGKTLNKDEAVIVTDIREKSGIEKSNKIQQFRKRLKDLMYIE